MLPPVSSDAVERVFDTISQSIGKKWKDLARALRIREGHIDSFENCKKIQDIVRQILLNHRACSDEVYWEINLCRALEKAGRKDLANEVNEILAMSRR